MSSDRRDFARGSPEPPPPYSGDTQLWAEDLDNYLRRRMQKIEDEVKSLAARVVALETRGTLNGSDVNDGAVTEHSGGDAEGPAIS